MPTPATRLFVVRHGESNAQAEGFFSGHDTCTGLSDRGRRQAAALHDRLASTGEFGDVAALYTSILPRAIETAGIIGPAFGSLVARQECDWCEMHAGEAEGLTFAELQERFPREEGPESPFHRRIPGCETWAEFYARVGGRLQRLVRDHPGETVVVAGHGGTVGASFVALGDFPVGRGIGFAYEARNTSITEWRSERGEWRLVRFNDAAHLAAR